MDHRDKILEFIKLKGPVLPVQIAKEIGSDILMASAHLAELTATNKLKVSAIKVGNSPLYYLQGQESMLQKFVSGMNDKEKKAYDMLQQGRALRDSELEPVIRVALREIKDFAVPLNVTHDDSKEIFWKWYLESNEDAEKLIKSKLNIPEKPFENKIEEKPVEKKIEERQLDLRQKEGVQKEDNPQTISKQPKEKRKHHSKDNEDQFLKEINKFFEKNKISIITSEIIKKNSEIEFILEIPSVVGNLQYYCRAKSKKRISDSDLSSAYVKGQMKRLPVLFISGGDLSEKAQGMMGKELNLTFKKI
ncbi:hypothetical protein HYV80_04550 [Candidatus Woesearchaeota archaeon]|nr:hypothetical protein [Candidatus Woesearchaeota archaeon]